LLAGNKPLKEAKGRFKISIDALYDSRLKETKIMVVVVVVLTITVRIITRVQLKSSSNWL
jgi:hypothetical protein